MSSSVKLDKMKSNSKGNNNRYPQEADSDINRSDI